MRQYYFDQRFETRQSFTMSVDIVLEPNEAKNYPSEFLNRKMWYQVLLLIVCIKWTIVRMHCSRHCKPDFLQFICSYTWTAKNV